MRLYAFVDQASIEAKQSAADPFSEIDKLMTWEALETSVVEAAKLARPEQFAHLALVAQSYPQLRPYALQPLFNCEDFAHVTTVRLAHCRNYDQCRTQGDIPCPVVFGPALLSRTSALW